MRAREYPRTLFSRAFKTFGFSEPLLSNYLEIADVVFFASTMLEEGAAVPIGVVVEPDERLERVYELDPEDSPPELAWSVTRLSPRPLEPVSLKKLARGTSYGTDLILIDEARGTPKIAGLARKRGTNDGGNVLRISAPRPGVLVLEGGANALWTYEGGQLRSDQEVLSDAGPVRDALRECGVTAWKELGELLRLARGTGCGAMFAFLRRPAPKAMKDEIRVRLDEPDLLARLQSSQQLRVGGRPGSQPESARAQQQRRELRARAITLVQQLGRLSAIDGAVLINPGFEVLGAGFVIPTGTGPCPPAVRALDVSGSPVEKFEGRGARHAAGLRFAAKNKGSVVFVVSADGPVTCITKLETGLTAWSVRVPET